MCARPRKNERFAEVPGGRVGRSSETIVKRLTDGVHLFDGKSMWVQRYGCESFAVGCVCRE